MPLSTRERTLTEKGRLLFADNLNKFTKSVDVSKQQILSVLETDIAIQEFQGLQPLTELKTCLLHRVDVYEKNVERTIAYLHTVNTTESKKYLDSLNHEKEHLLTRIENVIEIIDLRLEYLGQGLSSKVNIGNVSQSVMSTYDNIVRPKQRSVSHDNQGSVSSKSKSVLHKSNKHRSHCSLSEFSCVSTLSSAVIRQRAKAEAAHVRFNLAKQEAEILKQQAELQAKLNLLKSQNDVEQAEAMLKVLQEHEDSDHSSISSHTNSLEKSIQSERTEHFVKDQYLERSFAGSLPLHTDDNHYTSPSPPLNPFAPQFQPPDSYTSPIPINNSTNPRPIPINNSTNPSSIPNNNNAMMDQYSNLTKFMLKKELSLNRLFSFDDNPEFYAVWKSGFCDVARELDISPIEEMDLLIKYLGPESKRQALSIRASNARNPSRGLHRIWERLEGRFASTEIVEASLKKKLHDFPKISNNESKKLFDLSDIVAEIESLKEVDEYSSLLSYFDTASGVSPIVCKLPYSLREKWTSRAMNYKQTYGVSYPPFTFFSKFVSDMAKMRNDPSFFYENYSHISESQTTLAPNKTIPSNTARPVMVKKTETHSSSSHKKALYCPYHDSNHHDLNYCRNFRQLPLSERKSFLQNNSICAKCCKTNEHSSNDCKFSVYCGLCKSSDHVPALHENENEPQNNYSYSTMKQHGGETPYIKTSCTQVCDNTQFSKSCAKILLAKIFPSGRPEQSKLAYVILDDQSNQTLAKSKFFDMFNEHGPEIPYSLFSCAGHVSVVGRRASGYCIQPIDGSKAIEIPSLIECNDIPNHRSEIPTPDVARHHPHLADIAQYISPLNTDTEILLLIGRDVPSAHHIHDQRIGPLNGPFAQRTSLGWTIVGDVCLNGAHVPDTISVSKTSILSSDRSSFMDPCDTFVAREQLFTDPLFDQPQGEEKCALSIKDREFLYIMEGEEEDGDELIGKPESLPATISATQLISLPQVRAHASPLRANAPPLRANVPPLRVNTPPLQANVQPAAAQSAATYVPCAASPIHRTSESAVRPSPNVPISVPQTKLPSSLSVSASNLGSNSPGHQQPMGKWLSHLPGVTITNVSVSNAPGTPPLPTIGSAPGSGTPPRAILTGPAITASPSTSYRSTPLPPMSTFGRGAILHTSTTASDISPVGLPNTASPDSLAYPPYRDPPEYYFSHPGKECFLSHPAFPDYAPQGRHSPIPRSVSLNHPTRIPSDRSLPHMPGYGSPPGPSGFYPSGTVPPPPPGVLSGPSHDLYTVDLPRRLSSIILDDLLLYADRLNRCGRTGEQALLVQSVS